MVFPFLIAHDFRRTRVSDRVTAIALASPAATGSPWVPALGWIIDNDLSWQIRCLRQAEDWRHWLNGVERDRNNRSNKHGTNLVDSH